MRVLHVLNHTRRLNGHVHACVDLACEQTRQGHAVAVASAGGELDRLLRSRGIELVPTDLRRRPMPLARAGRGLYRFARLWRADVIHAHMMTSAVVCWPVCKMLGIPLIATVHNAFERSAILMGLGSRIIAVSAAVGRSMERRGIAVRRIDVVLNGTIGSARLASQDRAPRRLAPLSILFLGGLHPRKGLPDLIAAFDILHREGSQARLHVAGDGHCRESYENHVRRLACAGAVTFLGPQDEPFPLLAGADIVVLPSHADPAPLVIAEAREAGCAVVASAVDGVPELLEGGAAGLLVPPGDPVALADALRPLLQDPTILRDWKARSQINLDRLRIDRVARETIAVYERAGASHPGRPHRSGSPSSPRPDGATEDRRDLPTT